MFTVVHAQTSSTSRALRSSCTVVSKGDCIFPFASNNLATRQKQEEEPIGFGSLAAVLNKELARSKALRCKHHKCVRIRLGTFHGNVCCEQFGTIHSPGPFRAVCFAQKLMDRKSTRLNSS